MQPNPLKQWYTLGVSCDPLVTLPVNCSSPFPSSCWFSLIGLCTLTVLYGEGGCQLECDSECERRKMFGFNISKWSSLPAPLVVKCTTLHKTSRVLINLFSSLFLHPAGIIKCEHQSHAPPLTIACFRYLNHLSRVEVFWITLPVNSLDSPSHAFKKKKSLQLSILQFDNEDIKYTTKIYVTMQQKKITLNVWGFFGRWPF